MPNRILVIDDDESVRKAFELALEEGDHEVDTAASGMEGVEKVRSGRYGLIFLDLKMPGMDGIETLREIRKLDAEVPVYIVTAFEGEYIEELGKLEEEGISFELVNKPIGMDSIELLVKSVFTGPVESV